MTNRKPNPLSSCEPWDLVAVGYSDTTMEMLAQYAEEAITAVRMTPGAVILDVACGPGTLAPLVAEQAGAVHGIDFSQTMLDCYARQIATRGYGNITLSHGDAQALPYEDGTFDAAFSMFGLMFFPDRDKGFAEIYRTLKPGGTVAVTSWAPVDQSPAMQLMFGAIRTIKPDLPAPQRAIDTLENPERFRQEMEDAGFKNVAIRCVTKGFPVQSVAEFWTTMVKGSAPIQMLKKNLGEAEWRAKEALALAYLEQHIPSTPTSLTSDAWLGVGVK